MKTPKPMFPALAALLASAVIAAPIANAQTKPDDEIVELSPFVVRTDKDDGFVAASSLAGGRLATDLVDTPVAYSVQTRDFLDALNISDLNEALDWTVNATTTPDDGSGQLFGDMGPSANIRGLKSNGAQRNFFAGNSAASAYNIERIDYTRGPNSILFGMGTISGAANTVVKAAKPGRRFFELKAEAASWDSYKAILDANVSLGKRVAIRVAAIEQDSHTWRMWERTKREGVSPSITVNLSRKTTLKLVGEYYKQTVTAGEVALLDNLSAWDGKTTYSGTQASSLPAQTAQGASRMGGDVWIWSPSFSGGTDTVARWTGMMQTVALTTNSRAINGVKSSGGNLSFDGNPILEKFNAPEGLYDAAEAGSAFTVPSRNYTVVGPTPTRQSN